MKTENKKKLLLNFIYLRLTKTEKKRKMNKLNSKKYYRKSTSSVRKIKSKLHNCNKSL